MGRPETGRTGARFGAPARRAREDADEPLRADPPGSASREPDPDATALPGDGGEEPAVGLTGARFGGRARRPRRDRRARAADTPAPDDGHDDRPTVELPRLVDVEPPGDGAAPAVRVAPRPYVITGGRTKVRAELRLETMVSALGPPAGEAGERYTVLALCERPRSVSEVAALTGVPLGVARVLIDDLATEGRVRVHLGVDAASGPDMALLDRVLAGLRRL